MRRLVYIIILSAISVALITFLDKMTPDTEPLPEQPVLEETPESDIDTSRTRFDEWSGTDFELPYNEMVPDEDGRLIPVLVAYFRIGRLEPGLGNRFHATDVEFEYYGKSAPHLPSKERIIAEGSADKALLFSESDSPEEKAGPDINFKKEIVLEDHVVIHSSGRRQGSESIKMEADNLSFFNFQFRSSEVVHLSREDLSITGEGLFFDLETSDFTLDRNIRIEGRDFDLKRITELNTPDPPPPDVQEEKSTEPGPPLIITAAGSLSLEFADPAESARSAFPLPGDPPPPANTFRIQDHVTVTKGALNLDCETFLLEFTETAGGKSEIRSFHAASTDHDTVLRMEDYLIRCDEFHYGFEEGKELFRIEGNPEIDNVSLPLFESLAGASEPSLMFIHCGDLLEIRSLSLAGEENPGYDVQMSGGVSLLDKNNPGRPMLESETLSFHLMKKEAPPIPAPAADRETKGFDQYLINRFVSSGEVSGLIEPFDIQCTELTLDTSETLTELVLTSPGQSMLESEEFTLAAPVITLKIFEELTDIQGTRPFVCTAVVENLPRIKSFNLLPGDQADPASSAAPGPGKIRMKGDGAFRLFVREDEAGAHQTVKLDDGPFEIQMLQEDTVVLNIEGNERFSLVIDSGNLSSMNVRGGGTLKSADLGLTAIGDSLSLVRPGPDKLVFTTDGGEGSAFMKFTAAGSEDTFDIHAKRVSITSGAALQLSAEEKVRAVIPSGLFKKNAQAPEVAGMLALGKDAGPFRIQSSSMTIERPEGTENFILIARGNASIRNPDMGLDAICDHFTFDSGEEMLSMLGRLDAPTVIKLASPYDPTVFDTITSKRVDIDLKRSIANIYQGGRIVIHQYDKASAAFHPLVIGCKNDIVMREDLLEFNGPVSFDYQFEDDRRPRTMTCEKLWFYFVKSPLLSKLASWDTRSYKSMIKGESPQTPRGEENRLKRIKAQGNVAFSLDGFTGRCAVLEWDLLEDKILCDGGGKNILIAFNDNLSVQGGRILFRPVNEELTVLKN